MVDIKKNGSIKLKKLKIWNLKKGTLVQEAVHDNIEQVLEELFANELQSKKDENGIANKNITIKLKKTLYGHEDTILALKQISHDELATSSHDHTVKIWSISRGDIKKTLIGDRSVSRVPRVNFYIFYLAQI